MPALLHMLLTSSRFYLRRYVCLGLCFLHARPPNAAHETPLVLRLACQNQQAWNLLAGSSGAFLFPYLNLYLASRGLSSAQIGLLAALRTWLSAPVSLTATSVSDTYRIHKQLLLVACIASCGLRSSLPLVSSSSLLFGTLLLADLLGAPVGVLADSTVLSNCNEVCVSMSKWAGGWVGPRGK